MVTKMSSSSTKSYAVLFAKRLARFLSSLLGSESYRLLLFLGSFFLNWFHFQRSKDSFDLIDSIVFARQQKIFSIFLTCSIEFARQQRKQTFGIFWNQEKFVTLQFNFNAIGAQFLDR